MRSLVDHNNQSSCILKSIDRLHVDLIIACHLSVDIFYIKIFVYIHLHKYNKRRCFYTDRILISELQTLCTQSQLSKLPCLKITEEWKTKLDAPHIHGGWHNSTGFSSLSTTKVSSGNSGNYPFKDKTDRLMEHVIMQQVLSCPPNQGVLERNETPVTSS